MRGAVYLLTACWHQEYAGELGMPLPIWFFRSLIIYLFW